MLLGRRSKSEYGGGYPARLPLISEGLTNSYDEGEGRPTFPDPLGITLNHSHPRTRVDADHHLKPVSSQFPTYEINSYTLIHVSWKKLRALSPSSFH
jgi:hypothetical protein